jgi:hypothetical protein
MTTTPPARGYAGRTEYERIRIDEAALIDTLAARDTCPYPDVTTDLDDQLNRIRQRLPDHGTRVEERIAAGIRYIHAAPDHRDPQGTVRYVVIHPNGRRIPQHARTIDDLQEGR